MMRARNRAQGPTGRRSAARPWNHRCAGPAAGRACAGPSRIPAQDPNPHAAFAARALAAISLAVTDPQAAAVEFALLNDGGRVLETQHAKAASYLKTLDQLLIGAV